MPKLQDLSGQKFARLTAIKRITDRSIIGRSPATFWLCRCECGKETIVRAGQLKNSTTKSCGCLNIDRIIERNTTHGLSGSPEYHVWREMKARCDNPNNEFFARYGGRGVVVDPRWVDSFENFLKDMGPRPSPSHSIERKNNNGPYSSDNCRWATQIEQANNRSSNRLIIHAGRTQTLTQWCRELNVHLGTMTARLDIQGLNFEDALAKPCAQFRIRGRGH